MLKRTSDTNLSLSFNCSDLSSLSKTNKQLAASWAVNYVN